MSGNVAPILGTGSMLDYASTTEMSSADGMAKTSISTPSPTMTCRVLLPISCHSTADRRRLHRTTCQIELSSTSSAPSSCAQEVWTTNHFSNASSVCAHSCTLRRGAPLCKKIVKLDASRVGRRLLFALKHQLLCRQRRGLSQNDIERSCATLSDADRRQSEASRRGTTLSDEDQIDAGRR